MKAKIRGTDIYFDVTGTQWRFSRGRWVEMPVLFMLHGGPGGNHLRFKQHSMALQEVAQLVFIDHRGCGFSRTSKISDYTLENNIEDIEALRRYLGLERISLLGTSYGGMVAQGYAIRYPKKLDKLILNVTAPSFRFIEEAKAILQKQGTAKQMAMCEHLWKGTFKNPEHVMRFFDCTDTLYSVSRQLRRTKSALPDKVKWSHEALNKGFSDFLRRFDFIPKLHKITCPTLILAGADDWICPPSQSRIMFEHIPHAQLKIFKHCGHAIAVDAHDRYLREIKRFLRV